MEAPEADDASSRGRDARPSVVDRLGRRLRRLRLDGLSPAVRALVVLGWGLGAVLLALIAVPGLLEPLFTWDLDPPAPAWFRGLLLAACATVAAGCVVVSRLGDPRGQPSVLRALGRDVAVVAAGLGVSGLLLASDVVAPAVVAAASTVVTVTGLHVRSIRALGTALAAIGAAVPWLAALVAQFLEPDPGLLGWLWIVLLPLAGGAAAFGALYGVARGAQSRTGMLRRLFRDDLAAPVVALVVVLALGIVALRYTVLSGAFGEYDRLLWTLAPSWSWVHAGLVAALAVVVVARSVRRPLTRVGRRLATATFGTAAAIQLVFLGPLVLTVATTAIIGGTGVDVSDVALAAAPWIAVVLLVALCGVVAHRAFTASAGRWMAWVGAFYALPGAVASAAGPAFDDVPSFWAKPAQVAALLAVAAAGLLVADLLRSRAALPRRVVLRLALVPLVAVHATALLPAPWETLLGRAVVVAAAVVGILLFAPRRTADPRSRGRRLLARSTAQLGALVLFVLAVPSVLSTETFGIAGTLWLAIPVAVGLCLALVPRSVEPPPGTPAVLVDAEADGD